MPQTGGSGSESAAKCPLCGSLLTETGDRCSQCDWVKGYRHRDSIERHQPSDLIAVGLSVIPGAGHVYKGHTKAGIGFFVGVIVVIAILSALGIEGMGFQFLLLPIYWVWVMSLAYLIEDRRKV